MNIDAHIHLWRLVARRQRLAVAGQSRCCAATTSPPTSSRCSTRPASTRSSSSRRPTTLAETLFTLGLAGSHPWIAAWSAGSIRGRRRFARSSMALILNPRFRGRPPDPRRQCSIAWMLDARHEPGWRLLARARPVARVPRPELATRCRSSTHFAARHPGLSIILDHCAKPDIAGRPFEPWAGDDRRACRSRPNVSCKFSGLPQLRAPGAGADVLRPYSRPC